MKKSIQIAEKKCVPGHRAGYLRRWVSDARRCCRRDLHSDPSTFPVLSAVLWSKGNKSGCFYVV